MDRPTDEWMSGWVGVRASRVLSALFSENKPVTSGPYSSQKSSPIYPLKTKTKPKTLPLFKFSQLASVLSPSPTAKCVSSLPSVAPAGGQTHPGLHFHSVYCGLLQEAVGFQQKCLPIKKEKISPSKKQPTCLE